MFSRASKFVPALSIAASLALFAPPVMATSCTTQGQMNATQRTALMQTAQNLMGDVQSGNMQALQASTLPAVASDFSGIAASATALKPQVATATITVDALYDLDASSDAAGQAQTQFFCGSPVVVMTFSNLPPGKYALALIHATGVQQPQQVALILANNAGKWQLAGFYNKPMLYGGHDGLWYWTSARQYAQKKGTWAASLYYRLANDLLNPVDFLSSPNLQKLQRESQDVHADGLPTNGAVPLNAQGMSFQVTSVDTTTQFGALDLDVHYTPDPAQAAQLRDPAAARKQVIGIMSGLLAQHPELQSAFHGMWVHADQGNATLFALELPMQGIGGQPAAGATTPPAVR